MIYWWLAGGLIVILIGIGVLFGGAPFVPTRKKWIKDALKLAEIGENDVIVDLGSGDGAVLKLALKNGTRRAIGYEVNPVLALWSRFKLRKFRGKFAIKNRDFFKSNLPSDTTIIYLFQIDSVLRRIENYLEMQKTEFGGRKIKVVCFGFEIPGRKIKREIGGMSLYEF